MRIARRPQGMDFNDVLPGSAPRTEERAMIDEAEFDDAANQIAEASDAGEDSADPIGQRRLLKPHQLAECNGPASTTLALPSNADNPAGSDIAPQITAAPHVGDLPQGGDSKPRHRHCAHIPSWRAIPRRAHTAHQRETALAQDRDSSGQADSSILAKDKDNDTPAAACLPSLTASTRAQVPTFRPHPHPWLATL